MRKKSNIMKKVFGILLSMIMLLGTVSTVFAADGSATITITKDNESIATSLAGMKVNAYLVLDQVNPDEPTPNKKQYAVTEDFKAFFDITEENKDIFAGEGNVYISYNTTEKKLTYLSEKVEGAIEVSGAKLDVTYPQADIVSRLTRDNTDNAIASTFYTWMEKYIEEQGIAATKTVEATQTDSVVVGNLNEGYYALTFADVPNGISVKQGIMIPTNGSGDEAASIHLKAEELTVTKTVADGDSSPSDKIASAMNKTLNYEISGVTVPTLADYSNLTSFTLSDTLTNQKLDQTNFNLTVGSKTYTLNDSKEFVNDGETIASLESTDTTFTVSFITAALQNHKGEDVTLTYTAQMTVGAVSGTVNNNVKFEYDNNGSYSIKEDATSVHTYGINLQKTFSDGRKTDADVTFQLKENNEGTPGDVISLVENTIGTAGAYHVPAADENETISDLKLSTTDGTLKIVGLDAGTYWLEETTVPDGFTKVQPIKIVLASDTNDVSDLATSTTATYKDNPPIEGVQVNNEGNIAVVQFTVLNQKGFTLPKTGGAGTWMLTLGGIALIAAAGGLLMIYRRKSAK